MLHLWLNDACCGGVDRPACRQYIIIMEICLLGTAAAEGWPAPFCVCDACNEARRRGGPNIRMRAGALIDDDLKIDYGPDTVAGLQKANRHLAGLRTILFTHQHEDHITPVELLYSRPAFTNTPPAKLDVYGNAQVIAMLAPRRWDPEVISLHTFTAGDRFSTPAGDEVLALPADHVEGACVFRIRRPDGKVLFYGHDSGLYPQPTLDALSDGVTLDVALFDCTSGGKETSNRGHMAISGVIQMAEELRRRGAITPKTRCIATHFSHNGRVLHEELVAALLPHGIEVAFDGMVVRV